MDHSPPKWSDNVIGILTITAWFGLVTGLVEGICFLAVQRFRFPMGVWIEIVWIAALFDLALFSLLAVPMAVLARFLRQSYVRLLLVLLCVLLALLDWLMVALYELVKNYAILLLAIGLTVQFARWFRKHEEAALRFWRKSLPWVAGTTLLTLAGIQGGIALRERLAIANLRAAPIGAPNVLVIVVDTLRADHLSSYGYTRHTSPNIDELAEQGALFETAIAASSYTLPSHASLLTGRYSHEHGAEWETYRTVFANGQYPRISEILQDRGYVTSVFSANTFWFTREQGFGRGFIHFEDFFHSASDMGFRTLYGRVFEKLVLRRLGFEDIPARKRAPDVNRSFLRWLDRNQGQPFFAFLNYMDTHDPYLAPEPYRGTFSEVENPGGLLNWRVGRDYPELTPKQLQSEVDAYDGAILYVDDQIDQLVQELQRRGVADNTLLVLTSDHGEAFGEHGLFLHGHSLYRELIHVPLVLWWPGHVPEGVRVAQPVTNAAVPATIMDLLGASDQELFPGPSLGYSWESSDAHFSWPWPLAELAQRPWVDERAPTHYGWIKSLVTEQWHYIEHETQGVELFGWTSDPRESRDLADSQEMQTTIEGLGTTLETMGACDPR